MRVPSLREMTGSPLAIVAFLVNVAPLVGVFFWGWQAGALVVLYWLENLVIGVVNIVRMAASGVAHGGRGVGAAAFLIPFFCVHYGLFCFVHGMFVILLFSGTGFDQLDPAGLLAAALGSAPHMGVLLAVIAVWKVVQFAVSFIWSGAFRRVTPPDVMASPYARIIFIHLAIFAGGFALMALGQPIVGVIALVLTKAAFDAVSEVWEARKARETITGPAGESA